MSTNAAAVNRTPVSVSVSVGTLALLCTCFILSGIAALIYQTAWTRQFAIVFGTSELAVATVLAAYMAGLAFGAFLAEKLVPRVTRPVLTYALLEIGIAASAMFAVPFLLWLADHALQSWFGGQPTPPLSDHAGTTLFYLASAFVALALPTTFMGATLPMLARFAIVEERQIGRRIGLLYAMNTAGAVVGALLTAFLLLPELGLRHTVWAGAALNGIVFLLAIALALRTQGPPAPRGYVLVPEPEATAAPAPPAPLAVVHRESFAKFPGAAWVLPLMLLAGAVAFFQEVLWTRMLAHIIGSSIYSFGVMVASFLVGIAAGGGIGAAIAKTRASAAMALGIALIVAAVAAALAYLQLESHLPATAGLFKNVREGWLIPVPVNLVFSGLLLLPMTLAIGTTYPLAVRVLAHEAADAAPASARVYAWNTFGAIAGSLAAGFWLIPALRYEGAIRAAAYASAALGIAALWVLPSVRRVLALVASAVAVVAAIFFRPAPPERLLVTSPINVPSEGRLLYYEVGRSASVVMLAQNGGLALRTNGLPEALMDGPGATPRFSGEYWMSPLAVLARPQARDLLIVGFGGGVAVEAVPPSVERIDVVELEPKVIEANRATAELRRRNPLNDPRLTLIDNDARGALRLTARRYDAIVSQPSHPWTAGASHLYTREFMQLARDHLAPRGVFVQWMNVLFMDEALMRSLTATLLAVFPEVRVYRPDYNTIVFLASDAPLDPESHLAATGLPVRHAPLHYARFGIGFAEDLVAALVLDTPGARRFAEGAPIITDDDNRMATSSVWERQRGMTSDSSGRALAPYDPLQRPDSLVYGALRDKLYFPYILRRISLMTGQDDSLVDRIGRAGHLLGHSPEGAYARALYARLRGMQQRANELLRLAIDEFPDDEMLKLEYLRPWFAELAYDEAPPQAVEVATLLKGTAGEAILAAERAGVRADWTALVAAEPELARVPYMHPWYPEVVELRANLRSLAAKPEHKKRLAEEAIAMLDRVALLYQTPGLFAARARAGVAAERPDVVVESVASSANVITTVFHAGGSTAALVRDDLNKLSAILDAAAGMPHADAARIAEVRAFMKKESPPAN